jgi:two-component system, chemotaxis family, sensor kinase CheA
VVVGLAEQRLGIVVDSLLGQKEVVIKSLGSYLGNVKGIAGSTILGDGRVIVIIDVAQLMKMCIQINGIQ